MKLDLILFYSMKKYFQAPWKIKDLLIILSSITILFILTLYLGNYFPKYPLDEKTSVLISGKFLLQWVLIMAPLLSITFFKYKLAWKHFGLTKINPFKALGLAILAYIFYLCVNILISLSLIHFSLKIPGYELQPSIFTLFGKTNIDIAMAAIVSIILAPFLEELLFRGFLLRTLCDKFGNVIASIVTALLFSLMHFPWQTIIPVFILGLILNALVISSRSIWPAITFHILNNALSFTFLLMIEKGMLNFS